MIKVEKREVTVWYCDRCGKELKGGFSSVTPKGKDTLHFCNNWTNDMFNDEHVQISKPCYHQYEDERLKKLAEK